MLRCSVKIFLIICLSAIFLIVYFVLYLESQEFLTVTSLIRTITRDEKAREGTLLATLENFVPGHKERLCVKTYESQSYAICERLPFSSLSCDLDSLSFGRPDLILFRVPNIAHFVWFGSRPFTFLNYLSIRSMASIQRPEKIILHYDILPSGRLWKRTIKEMPCIQLNQVKEPTEISDVQMQKTVVRTSLFSMKKLIQDGGIFVDMDVITMKSFDPLRMYPLTLGRGMENMLSTGAILCEMQSEFLIEFYETLPKLYQDYPLHMVTTKGLCDFYLQNPQLQDKVHLEELTFHRPNPSFRNEKPCGTTLDNIDIGDNYILHVHPTQARKCVPDFMNWDENKLRKLDSSYGTASRMALFGLPDLIFAPGERVHNRTRTTRKENFKVMLGAI